MHSCIITCYVQSVYLIMHIASYLSLYLLATVMIVRGTITIMMNITIVLIIPYIASLLCFDPALRFNKFCLNSKIMRSSSSDRGCSIALD